MRNPRLRYGITRSGNGFQARYWLPGAERAALRFEDGSMVPLHAEEGWLFGAELACVPHRRYRLEIDGETRPDPYARFLPDGVDGPAEVVDLEALPFEQPPVSRPIHEVVILEVHVGTATPAGTYRALIDELPRYRELGITAIELLPLNQYGGEFGWGYDGVFFFAPHHAYGTPEELAAFIDAAHRLGLMVFNDVVYNHVGPVGDPWKASAPAFERPDHTTPWGPTPDFRQPAVREIVVGNVLEWLDQYRFDGLRFDAVHTIYDESERHILDEIAEAIHRGPGENRHIHLILENDDNELSRLRRPGARVFDAQWNDDLHHALHVAATGENGHYYRDFQDQPLHHVGRCLTRGFAYYGEHSLHRGRARGEPCVPASPFAFCNFAQNHDQVGNRGRGDRLNASHGADVHWLCATIAWLAPGVPMLWMGEESGSRRDFPFFGDYPESWAPAVRKGRKQDHEGLPGFDGEIPDPCARATFEAAKLPGGHEDRVHADRVAALLAVRRTELAPRYRDLEVLTGDYDVVGAVLRVRWPLPGGETLILVANFGTEAARTDASPGRALACTHDPTQMMAGELPAHAALFALEDER